MVQDILSWSKTILASTPLRWQYLLDTYPQDLLLSKPSPTEWSAYDCLQHLLDVERVSTSVRLKAFLAGEGFPDFDPNQQAEKDAPSSILGSQFAEIRQDNLSLLAQFNETDLLKEVRHAEYGMVSLSQFLHHLVGHDLMHTVQAEQAMMQPMIKGSGAWFVNYTAHIPSN
ncbi:MAG: hypothetical protein Phog2KO_13920 [Phototrophicaceae bacterium]